MIAHNDKYKTDNGYVNLAWAVIEQAVDDVHVLRRHGVIKDGKLQHKKIDAWPIHRHRLRAKCKFNNYYDHPLKVAALIEFINGKDLDEWLEMLGAPHLVEPIRSVLTGEIRFIDHKAAYERIQP